MGIFDKNIHMNGAGTSYQAFLDLADAAERQGGEIGNLRDGRNPSRHELAPCSVTFRRFACKQGETASTIQP